MEKKTKLTISGSAKKSIKNIEIAKTQNKNTVVIEKQTGKFTNRAGSFRTNPGKPKPNSFFGRGIGIKPTSAPKLSPITNDFERRKLAEQRATKRLKGDGDGKEKKILTLEDFADLASDELTGGFDVVKGERVKIQGYLEDFALSKEEADELIMSARNIVYKD